MFLGTLAAAGRWKTGSGTSPVARPALHPAASSAMPGREAKDMDDQQPSRGLDSSLPLEGYRILVVDDEADVRIYLGTVLEDAGATVLEAEDGDEGLETAKRERPDLITLDLSMPGKDGVETFGALRQAEETRSTPVCIITGHSEYRQLIYQRTHPPPDGFMSKPIGEEQLVSTVRRILGLRRRKAERTG